MLYLGKKTENKYLKEKNNRKVRGHCHYTADYRGAALSICNVKYSVPKKIAIALHNGSNYDYHFIIKKLAGEFKKTICLFMRKYWTIHNLYGSNRKRS